MEPAAHSPEYQREQLVLLAAFQSTYSDTTTPLTPDMVPLVIDTGASVTITPFQTDFITPLQPVQQTTIQGIASGLQVAGRGTVCYTFRNDDGEQQTVEISPCLYVPQCTVRLLCPRQILAMTGHNTDGFTSLSTTAHLTVEGKSTTLTYDSLTKLPYYLLHRALNPIIPTLDNYSIHTFMLIHPLL
jgi:hypothetical protein